MTRLTQKLSSQSFCTIIRFVTLALLLTLFGVSAVLAQTKAYVTNADDFTVSVIDTTTNTIVATIPDGPAPVGIAVTPNGAFIYVTHLGGSTVSVIDATTNTVIATVPVGLAPAAVAITSNGAFAYVTNQFSNTVSVINTATNTVVSTVPVGWSRCQQWQPWWPDFRNPSRAPRQHK